MKTSFWERLRFLFDPESLEISIYEVHRKILDDVTLERRKLENDKRYVWVRMRKLQDEVRLLNQEILEMKSGRAGDELRDDLDGKGLRWQRPKDMDEG